MKQKFYVSQARAFIINCSTRICCNTFSLDKYQPALDEQWLGAKLDKKYPFVAGRDHEPFFDFWPSSASFL